MTREPNLIGLFIAPLNRAGIEYMVTGGLAAIVYGQPRLTLDIDLRRWIARMQLDAEWTKAISHHEPD